MAAKQKAKKSPAQAQKPAGEMLLVGSKTKAALKDHGVNVSGDCLDALNALVHWYIAQAAARAGANGRKTVRGHDFIIG
jgi:histone H3/H4